MHKSKDIRIIEQRTEP
uniref:Uncharacterized protein n=1 Tax=Rhizophora mucronata TaxID=61149 RepID=A0A2P2K009_RHIMU